MRNLSLNVATYCVLNIQDLVICTYVLSETVL